MSAPVLGEQAAMEGGTVVHNERSLALRCALLFRAVAVAVASPYGSVAAEGRHVRHQHIAAISVSL